MSIKIALAGNPNCGKTTLFNALTGSNQFVGNWPGVTVEKKEGFFKGNKDIVIQDLPGIYSLSPYTPEEVISRTYLVNERPDVILNIIDGTNIERNLYLTTQLAELGIPMVVAINMTDIVRKNGDKIDIKKLEKHLGAKVCEISALKGTGTAEAAQLAVETAKKGKSVPLHSFDGEIEHTLAHIEEHALSALPEERQRWFAVKIFERDEKISEMISIPQNVLKEIDVHITACEEHYDDDAESIITSARYSQIDKIIKDCYKRANRGNYSTSDKIDKVVTNRFLALPIFAAVMFLIYYIAIGTVGDWVTGWTNDNLFGDGFYLFNIGAEEYDNAVHEYEVASAVLEAADANESVAKIVDEDGNITDTITITKQTVAEAKTIEEPDPAAYGKWVSGIPVVVTSLLDEIKCADWLKGLIVDGIVGGVGAVLGFVPQMLVLFLMLCILEDIGYMARVAFIMDRIFRRFGLSGKSFIPMLVGSGCGVPGVMASRTIEQERDRRMTIMTTCFVPCGAKMPIVALIAGALFAEHQGIIATSAYFVGVLAIVFSGIVLKKFKAFAGEPAPFVMELPAYHLPTVGNILRGTWERGWSFIKRAGTVILLSTVLLWFLQGYGIADGALTAVEDNNTSLLASIGSIVAPLFTPLGWGNWKAVVASVTGLIAKENVVGTFGVLYGMAEVAEDGAEIWSALAADYTAVSAYSFLMFNLLCAPCFAAIGAIKREMNNNKWTLATIGYMTVFAYLASLVVYQIGGLITGEKGFGIATVFAIITIVFAGWLLFRKGYKKTE